jgi:hypothetical protein
VCVAAKAATTNAISEGILVENRPRLIQVWDHETGTTIASPIAKRRKKPTKIIVLEIIARKYLILHHYICTTIYLEPQNEEGKQHNKHISSFDHSVNFF